MTKRLLSLLLFLFTTLSFAQLFEGFENAPPVTGPLPATWPLGSGNWAVFERNSVPSNGTSENWGINPFAAGLQYQGTDCASVSREQIGMGNTSEDWLATPQITLPVFPSELHFYTRTFIAGNQGTIFKVYVAPAIDPSFQSNPAVYSLVQQWTETSLITTPGIYQEKIVDLTPYAGFDVYIAFVREYTQPTSAIDGDRWMIDNVSMQYGCTGSNCNTLLSLVPFIDANNNGIKDSGEVKFTGGQFTYQINNSGVDHYAYPNAFNGSYIMDSNHTDTYNIDFTVYNSLQPYYSCSTSFSNQTTPTGGMATLYFPVTVIQPFIDARASLSGGFARAGNTSYLNVVYGNNGFETIPNGTLTFTKDPNVTLTYLPPGAVATPTGFTYDFTNLLPGISPWLSVGTQIPAIPTVSLGQVLSSTVSVQVANDAVASNNSFTLNSIVNASFDPNNMSESHGEKIVHSTFTSNDYLYYTIQFENIGNAYAQSIRVEDLLNGNLDEASFEMIGASHMVDTRRTGNQLSWYFEDISLPPTATNPNDSHGYINFRIKPKPGYAIGDIIPNTASIYFDSNPAIVTNTFNTEFVQQLGTPGFNANTVSIYPNPANASVQIAQSGNEPIQQIAFYDISGKKVLDYANPSSVINVSSLEMGIYFVEITSDNKKAIKKLIINR